MFNRIFRKRAVEGALGNAPEPAVNESMVLRYELVPEYVAACLEAAKRAYLRHAYSSGRTEA